MPAQHSTGAAAPLVVRGMTTRWAALGLLIAAAASSATRTDLAPKPAETVLIVGASRGIGLGLAGVYAAAGARVHATARNVSSAAALAALAAQHPDHVTIHPLEVRDGSQVAALAKALDLQHVELDLLIYNAGTNKGDLATQP